MRGFGNKKENIRKRITKEKEISIKNQLLSNAFQYHSKGKIKEASDLYKNLIKSGYYDPRVITNLGTIYQQVNDIENAIRLYKESIKRFPNSPEAYSNLARILVKKNNHEEAKIYLNKSIKLNPTYFMSYSILASIQISQGEKEKAEISLRKSIEINPNEAGSYLNLGCLLKDQGKSEEAEISLRKALKMKPENEFALVNLAAVLNDFGKTEEAEKLLEQAIKINPNSSIAFNNLGNVFINKNLPFKAEINYKKAIKLEPNSPLILNNLGSLLISSGNIFEAQKYIQKAIDCNPKFELAYVNLGSIKFDLNKPHEAENLYLKAIEIKDDYQYAYISLFDFYDKTNNLEKLKQSLNLYKENKYIKNEILMFKARLVYREKDFVKAKDFINKIADKWLENTNQKTILLFWSFKAFIEDKVKNFEEAHQCFARSQLNPAYEKCNPTIFVNYIREYKKNLDINNSFKRKNYKVYNDIEPVFLLGFPRSGTTLLDTILRSHPEIDVLEEKPIIQSIESIITSKYNYSLSELYKLSEDQLRILREHYLKNLKDNSTKGKKAKILIDKFPFNTVCLPLINLMFPNAKIIFTHRNPYDTVLSCFQQAFEPNNAMSNFRSINSSAKIYDITMNCWVDYKDKLNLKFVMSKYEDLIEDFDAHILKVLNFLDVNWDDNLKNYRDTAFKRGKINTPSSLQVIQPLYKTSIEKWRNYEKFFEDSHFYLKKWKDFFNY